ncbi:hypothetical protein RSAG8_01671, partial [Rhizoctonia solani AG-8 WAC10335]
MAETQTTAPAEPPHLTSVDRVGKIPVVNDTLTTINSILSQNAYSKGLYSTAQAYSERAYDLSQPVQIRLAPVIGRVDGYANKGLDALESRWPYPFHVTTGEVIGTLRQGPDFAYGLAAAYANAATKTYEDRVKTPAYVLVSKVDSTLFTPIVDCFEIVVNKFHKEAPSSPSSVSSSSSLDSEGASERQYTRAYRLSLDLKDQIIVISSEQLKQLQQNNVYIQRATESLYNLTNGITNLSHESSSRAHHNAVKVRDVVISRVQPVLRQVIEEGKKLVGRAKVKEEESKETPEPEVKEARENGATKENGATNGSA